jgi:putative DNA primase/helicase
LPRSPTSTRAACPEAEWFRYARCGLGILTRNTPALDADVTDPELAESIRGVADRVLGKAPFRIGRAPKWLMPFRLQGEAFKKMSVVWTLNGQPGAVELLADCEQFVAFGVHPITKRPYAWHRDPDLDLPHGLLPPLSRAKGLHLMRSLAGALERIGASGIRLRGAPGHRPAARPMRAPNAEGDAERIRQALERIGNSNTHYDDWIRIGHAIKAALPGAGGQELWCWWSSLSGKDRPEITRRKWATFDPRTISAGTIFHLAREGAR